MAASCRLGANCIDDQCPQHACANEFNPISESVLGKRLAAGALTIPALLQPVETDELAEFVGGMNSERAAKRRQKKADKKKERMVFFSECEPAHDRAAMAFIY
jgi:hypothetical protein